MYNIAIISSSVRIGRASHRLALFFKKYITENGLAQVDFIDLAECAFPIFEERFEMLENPAENEKEFANRIRKAEGVLIVTPEYNGGYPASLKNIVDFLTLDWKRKPVAIATASGGPFAASQVLTSLQFSLWKIKALTVASLFQVPHIEESYDENGVPANPGDSEKRARVFMEDFIWMMEAVRRMK